jgi:alanine dehydrogenase
MMRIGLPKEIKNHEYRVGMIPNHVKALTRRGHNVLVERGAGIGSGFLDSFYKDAGAQLIDSAEEVWTTSDMIVKVKEPVASEYDLIQEGQLIYTYLHLAADPALTEVLLKKNVSGVAYETIETTDGRLPLLVPMSQVAGRMATQVGAQYLQKANGGKGVLLGGVPGTRRGRVVILGGGVVGTHAAQIAVGMGADVRILDINPQRLEQLDFMFNGRVQTLFSDPYTIAEQAKQADLLIGAVLITGAKAPTLVNRQLISEMEAGTVVVDVAVDQGGCIETCHPTTHDAPTFMVEDIVHYCVANMPGAVSRTSTLALNNTTRPHLLALVDHGVEDACQRDPSLMLGLNTYRGKCTHQAVATSLGYEYSPLV